MAARKGKTEADVVITFAEGTCQDGCGAELNKGRSFKQGHDAKLHSVLAAALKAGSTTVQFNDAPVITIEAEYANHGWTIPVPKPKAEKTAKTTKAVKDEPTEAQADAAEAAEAQVA